jgi:hypothetical protein
VSQVLSVRLSDSVCRLLADASAATGVNVSTIARVVIERAVRDPGLRRLIEREADTREAEAQLRKARARSLTRHADRLGLLDIDSEAVARELDAVAKRLTATAAPAHSAGAGRRD